MNNETKREVFDQTLNDWKQNFISSLPRDGSFEDWSESLSDYSARYDAALPDDLPVVSKDVSNTMITYRFLWWKEFLDKAYGNEFSDDEDINYRIRSESAEVARALILGVWCVEETREVVRR